MGKQKKEKKKERPRHKCGRPEKTLKIGDRPRNITRALFGLPPLKERHISHEKMGFCYMLTFLMALRYMRPFAFHDSKHRGSP